MRYAGGIGSYDIDLIGIPVRRDLRPTPAAIAPAIYLYTWISIQLPYAQH